MIENIVKIDLNRYRSLIIFSIVKYCANKHFALIKRSNKRSCFRLRPCIYMRKKMSQVK